VRSLLREGAWAGAFLALSQVVQVVILKVANREAGAPTVYQFAFILFTLPHALFAVPVMTTRFPEMTRAAHAADWPAYRRSVGLGTRSIVYLGLAATAMSVAVAHPAARLLAYGKATRLAPEIADATMAFAPGIVGFGLLLFFTRAMYANGDTRTPALVNLGVVAGTSAVMLGVVPQLSDRNLVTGLAGAFAVGNVVGAIVLGALVQRRLRSDGGGSLRVVAPATRSVAAAVVAGGLGILCSRAIGWDDKSVAALGVAVASVVVVVAFVGVSWATGGPAPRVAAATLGAGEEP
jgi:putative peptidoglycan lipid II flippase